MNDATLRAFKDMPDGHREAVERFVQASAAAKRISDELERAEAAAQNAREAAAKANDELSDAKRALATLVR